MRQHALLLVLMAAVALSSRPTPAAGNQCDWAWKYYHDAWLRTERGNSTIDNWYRFEVFERETLPGGNAWLAAEIFTLGWGLTPVEDSVPGFQYIKRYIPYTPLQIPIKAIQTLIVILCLEKTKDTPEDNGLHMIGDAFDAWGPKPLTPKGEFVELCSAGGGRCRG